MDIELSTEDLAFKAEVKEFFHDNQMKKGEDYFSWRSRWFEKAKEKGGWDVPKWPLEFGGPGWTPTQHYIWEQETSRATLPFDLPFGTNMLAPILMGYGNKEQQDRLLPDIRARKVNWCQGYSETGAGSDLANLKTKAELSEDGTYYTVNGSKIWTSSAHIADFGWLAARTDPKAPKHKGISLFMVDMKSAGVTVRPIYNMAGSHEFNEVFFEDVRIPSKNLVGEENRGWYTLAVALDFERSGVGYSANARRILASLTNYVKSAKKNGKPLSENQLVRNRLAERHIETEVSRSMSYKVAWMQSNGMKRINNMGLLFVFIRDNLW